MKVTSRGALSFVCFVTLTLALVKTSSAQIVLNEIMADNRGVFENGDDFPDYIELLNVSGTQVNLAGMGLSDDILLPKKFAFPPNTLLNPGSYLVIFADDKTNSPGLHTGFGLNDKGEIVTLVSSGGGALDTVTFGLQLPDRSVGRVPNGTGAWTLNRPTPGEVNEAEPLGGPQLLSINEWMALKTKSSGDVDDDWLEIYNGTNRPVLLGGLFLSDASVNAAIPALTFIDALGFLQFLADDSANKGAEHLPFKLSSTSGETLTIFSNNQATVLNQVTFGAQTANISQGRLPDGAPAPYTFFPVGRSTPAASNFLPLTNIVFNELLTHTDPPLEDAVELFNPTPGPVDISGWWLSDDRTDPKRFRIPANTVLPSGGYKVFYEINFNPSFMGVPPQFSFNSFQGEEVNLYSADAAGNLTGFRLRETFPPAQNGVSFGRYTNSDGDIDFVAMSRRTFGSDTPNSQAEFRLGTGLPNSLPLVGPAVINEIMYHPPDIIQGTNRLDDSLNEFVELRNVLAEDLPLFDPAFPTNTWRLRDAVAITLPMNITLPPGGSLLLVNFDPVTNTTQLAQFRSKYNVPESVRVVGPYKGKLSNGGDSVELLKPDPPQTTVSDFGFTPYILVDRVNFNDKAPWPELPDGGGFSLQKIAPETYGNDPINWTAEVPSPGRESVRVLPITRNGDAVTIQFRQLPGVSYTLQFRDSLTTGNWNTLTTFALQNTSTIQSFLDSNLSSRSSRFYRIISP